MHIDHKNISNAYAKLFESSSQHTLKHVIELKITNKDGIDLDIILDGICISSRILSDPSDAEDNITSDVDSSLKEKIGDISDYVLPRLLDNLEVKIKDIIKRKTKVSHLTITRVVVSGTYTVTESLVGNY